MLIVSYDISDDKLRTKFSKFLEQFGYRLQYSVFKIKNSRRVLKNVIAEIDGSYAKKFTQSDSIIIFLISKKCKTYSFGYAKNEEKSFLFVS